MGGLVDGQLRLAGSRYSPVEFWAGPLNDDGSPPEDCDPFDRIYKVSREEVDTFESTGVTTPDLVDWPTGLGAPTLAPAAGDGIDNDEDGDIDEAGEMRQLDLTGEPLNSRVDRTINLDAGERPAILGDQMLWWVMNDRGNQHAYSDAPPIGVEVHGSVFAFNTSGAVGNSTFYRYRIFYKGAAPLTDTYFGIFSDPDIGGFGDDYVGSDTTRGIGYAYNADNDDVEYGEAPPATGYVFVQGPLVNNNGIDDNGNGKADEENERLNMTAFIVFNSGGSAQGAPREAPGMYNYMQARWLDGERITFGGNGLGASTTPTNFMYPGNPPEFWTEFDSDGEGTPIAPSDRYFVMSSGPFTMQPDDVQEIVFGIVTSFGTDNIDSVQQLKTDVDMVRAFSASNRVVVSTQEVDMAGNALLQNFPNPFSSTTSIEYSLEKSGPVTLQMYDIQGRRIRVLLDHAVRPAGIHRLDVDLNGLAGGLYFYVLMAGDRQETRMMHLLK